MDCRQIVVDYIEGRITTKEFLDAAIADERVYQWLQSVVPAGKIGYYDTSVDENGKATQEVGPYDVRRVIAGFWKCPWDKLGNELNTHYEITRIFQEAFPQEHITPDQSIEEKFDFLLDACPSYIGGEEVAESGILERLYERIPKGLGKSAQKKWFREEVKKLFLIEDKHYPCWLQEPEWPMSDGKPMKYISSKKRWGGEGREYLFEDTHTHRTRTIMQIF